MEPMKGTIRCMSKELQGAGCGEEPWESMIRFEEHDGCTCGDCWIAEQPFCPRCGTQGVATEKTERSIKFQAALL